MEDEDQDEDLDYNVLALRQALFDAYAALGFDTDGDITPAGWRKLRSVVTTAAESFRSDYDHLLHVEGELVDADHCLISGMVCMSLLMQAPQAGWTVEMLMDSRGFYSNHLALVLDVRGVKRRYYVTIDAPSAKDKLEELKARARARAAEMPMYDDEPEDDGE